jgi:hypothetical protein
MSGNLIKIVASCLAPKACDLPIYIFFEKSQLYGRVSSHPAAAGQELTQLFTSQTLETISEDPTSH